MKYLTRRASSKYLGFSNRIRNYKRRLGHLIERTWATLRIANVLISEPKLRNRRGARFVELCHLLEKWLYFKVQYSSEFSKEVCDEFYNALKNCDKITYNDPGSADAYVILHFLDRYRRFQIVFDHLEQMRVMPARRGQIFVLDIGTGPGPSMFAVSDFYIRDLWRLKRGRWNEKGLIKIDYAELSNGFRHWLHHFTELANSEAPSGVTWEVPFHHGTVQDFGSINFNRRHTYADQDEIGQWEQKSYIEKIRPSLIIMSNFLTTQEQANALAESITLCARNLRHRGVLLIVGARRSIPKYCPVYEIIDRAVLGHDFSKPAFKAKCEKVLLDKSQLSYNINDEFGQQIKSFWASVARVLDRSMGSGFPSNIRNDLLKWSGPAYNKDFNWEIVAYRKVAVPRRGRRSRKHRKAKA